MKTLTSLSLMFALLFVVSCKKEAPAADTGTAAESAVAALTEAAGEVTDAVAASTETAEYEVACAGCIFKMAGAKGCQAAIKVDDKTYLIKGTPVDAHVVGLCGASAKANLSGAVKDGVFVATSFALLPGEGGHGHDH